MINPPKTQQQAAQLRYGAWAGLPKGRPYDPGKCAYEVGGNPPVMLFSQCLRKPGHGPDWLYCKQHAKKVDEQSKPTT